MKILYVITGLGLGGAERVVVDLSEQMSLLGHDVKIAYLKGEAIVKPISTDIELVALEFEGISSLILASKKYKAVVKEFNPDVVHAHMIHANIFARLNRPGTGVPKLICTAHNSNEGGKLRMLAYRYTNHLSDINTNVSQEASQSLIDKGAFTSDNLITIYNGISLSKFNKIKSTIELNSKGISFLSVGRFNEQKDYPNLLKAVAILKNKTQLDIKFYIAGDGELRSFLESLIEELGIENEVILLGKRSDIPHLLSKANFFVLPSKHEGLPTVVIEAMACSCYVIATDCGGSAEILGDTGKLVSIQNSEALAGAMETALSLDKHDIELNNQKARLRIEEKFSLESSVQKWLEIYAAE